MTKKPSKMKDPVSAASTDNPSKMAEKEKLLKPKSTEMKMTLRTRSAVEKAKPIIISSKESKPKPKTKKKGDSKAPKKPPTAFFYFLEDFRKEYQKQNPNIKSMRDVGKACGEKWKTMSYEEKVQYYDIATEKRAAFDDAMAEYKKRKEHDEDQGSGGEDYEE